MGFVLFLLILCILSIPAGLLATYMYDRERVDIPLFTLRTRLPLGRGALRTCAPRPANHLLVVPVPGVGVSQLRDEAPQRTAMTPLMGRELELTMLRQTILPMTASGSVVAVTGIA